jgi:hypothetical protein
MFLKASNYKALQFLSDMCVQVVSEFKATSLSSSQMPPNIK